MSNGALILVNLIVVAALIGLIAEEVDGGVIHSGQVLLRLEVLQAVGFIPTGGEDIEGYLSADGVATVINYIN